MKRFMLLHIGFEQPTPELMGRWKAWFESIAPHTVENVGLRTAREISKDGVAELAWAETRSPATRSSPPKTWARPRRWLAQIRS